VRFPNLGSLVAVLTASTCVVACAAIAGISQSASTDGATANGEGGANDSRTDANISITADLDFGDLPCGTESTAKLLTIHNAGATATTYKVVIPDGTPFRIDGALTGPLPAHSDPVTLKVFAKPGTAAVVTADMVVSAGDAVQPITATAHGTGATFELTPPLIDFGAVRMQSGAGPSDVIISNHGSEPVSVSAWDPSPDFAVAMDSPTLAIPAGGTGTVHASFKPASVESSSLTAMLHPVITQALCGEPPVLTLSGSRVNSNVTLSSGDFGNDDCTSQTGAKDVTISNYSSSMLTYTATLQAGASSPFEINGAATGTVAAGTTAVPQLGKINVQPKAYGTTVGTLTDTLMIDIPDVSAPDGGPRTVPLTVNVHGAIVTFTPTSITNFSSDGSRTDEKTFTAKNTGSDTIYLLWGTQTTQGNGSAWNIFAPSSLKAGETSNGVVDFRPGSSGTSSVTLSAIRIKDFSGNGAVSCTALAPITLSGVKN
jgi:hypothetical protein